MEPQQNNQQSEQDGSKNSSSYLCRQSSTRWTPTSDQIGILKDLYYNNGVRSPSADDIQRISARLRQYGKIEGKNVFYWFQNHKARERQKKRFTTTTSNHITMNMIPMQQQQQYHHQQQSPSSSLAHNVLSGSGWRSSEEEYHHHHPIVYNKHPASCIAPGVPAPASSSPGVVAFGKVGSNGYGSLAMEKSFRECSISPPGHSTGRSTGHNFGRVGVDPYSSRYPFLDQKNSIDHDGCQEGEEEEEEEDSPEIETLPLFPMHGGDNTSLSGFYTRGTTTTGGWYRSSDAGIAVGASRASLELSLYSFSGRPSDFL